MNPLILIVGLFVLYEYLTSRKSAGQSPTMTAGTSPTIVQQGQAVSAPGYTLAPAGGGPGGSTTLIGSSVGVGLGFVPIVGPALSAAYNAIFGSLMAASAKRAAQARNENSAVANEIPQWDAAVDQIATAYNNGSISADEAYQLLACPQTRQQGVNNYPNGAVWLSYWRVVGPQVQPGRNACQSGNAPHQPPLTHCSGGYGAGCCVAYDDLDNGQLYVVWAIQQAEQTGQAVTSKMIPTVYGSKYGGINRPGYSITVRKPVSSIIPL